MKILNSLFFFAICIMLFSCNSDNKSNNLLTSNDTDDIIEGAIKAGDKRDEKFIPLLLAKAGDARGSTNFNFKGVSVYQAKMQALQKIFKVNPPVGITDEPDSTIIKFYMELYKKEFK